MRSLKLTSSLPPPRAREWLSGVGGRQGLLPGKEMFILKISRIYSLSWVPPANK